MFSNETYRNIAKLIVETNCNVANMSGILKKRPESLEKRIDIIKRMERLP